MKVITKFYLEKSFFFNGKYLDCKEENRYNNCERHESIHTTVSHLSKASLTKEWAKPLQDL